MIMQMDRSLHFHLCLEKLGRNLIRKCVQQRSTTYLLLPMVVFGKLAPESSRISKGLLIHVFIVLPRLYSCSGLVLVTLQFAQHAELATSRLHSERFSALLMPACSEPALPALWWDLCGRRYTDLHLPYQKRVTLSNKPSPERQSVPPRR